MRCINAKPPVFIGDIDLGNRTILRIDIAHGQCERKSQNRMRWIVNIN